MHACTIHSLESSLTHSLTISLTVSPTHSLTHSLPYLSRLSLIIIVSSSASLTCHVFPNPRFDYLLHRSNQIGKVDSYRLYVRACNNECFTFGPMKKAKSTSSLKEIKNRESRIKRPLAASRQPCRCLVGSLRGTYHDDIYRRQHYPNSYCRDTYLLL